MSQPLGVPAIQTGVVGADPEVPVTKVLCLANLILRQAVFGIDLEKRPCVVPRDPSGVACKPDGTIGGSLDAAGALTFRDHSVVFVEKHKTLPVVAPDP